MKWMHLSILLLITLCQGTFLIAQNKITVLGTASIFSDIASEIGGEYIVSQTIVPIGADPHTYQPTPTDVEKVRAADIVLRNGLTFEGWLSSIIFNSGTEANIVLITEGIKPIESLVYDNATDPHAWMNPLNGKIYARNIADAIIDKIPEHKEEIRKNLSNYLYKLDEINNYAQERIGSVPEKQRVLITSHDAFQYFGRQYNVVLESILGISTDADIQTQDIIKLNKVIQESGVKAVFIESTINPKVLKQIAEDNNIAIGGELYADSIGEKDSEAPTYLDMLRHNIDTFVDGITGGDTEHKHKQSIEDYDTIVYIFLGFIMIGVFVFSFLKFNNTI